MTATFPGGSETVFTYGAPLLKFGPGASDEIGYDLSQYGARRVLVVTDPGIAATGLPALGVGDMVGIEGTEERVVMLSERSELVCPMHEFRLVPDACRSCRFLAGEAA